MCCVGWLFLPIDIMNAEASKTYVCVLTAASRGALAVIRIWGRDALAVADRAFRPAHGVRLANGPCERPRFGRAGERVGEEIVALIGSEYPLEVEFHCHGGRAAVDLVLAAIENAGAEHATAERWIARPTQESLTAQALADMANAPTLRTFEILLEQSQGALRSDLDEITRLVRFGDRSALLLLKTLIERGKVGTRLITGWMVAIAGRPNVGKSRLLNALAGYERAIVDPSPGTTRDVISLRTAFDGWPVNLHDTAGLRESADAIEVAGIVMARARHAEADLTLLVLDRSEPLTAMDRMLIEGFENTLVVANKSDLPAVWEPWDSTIVHVSAEHGLGLDVLGREIAKRLVREAPPPRAGVPFRRSHLEMLHRVIECLKHGEIPEAIVELRSVSLRDSVTD